MKLIEAVKLAKEMEKKNDELTFFVRRSSWYANKYCSIITAKSLLNSCYGASSRNEISVDEDVLADDWEVVSRD